MGWRPNKVTIHCTDTTNGMMISREWLHHVHVVQNGWDDIGYHFIINTDGSVIDGRPMDRMGAHVKGHNRDNIGIALVGRSLFHREQFKRLRQMLDAIRDNYFIPANEIYAHYELDKKGKTCPNIRIDDIIRWYVGEADYFIEQYLFKTHVPKT